MFKRPRRADHLARRAKQLLNYGKGAWTASGLKSRKDNCDVLIFNEMAQVIFRWHACWGAVETIVALLT